MIAWSSNQNANRPILPPNPAAIYRRSINCYSCNRAYVAVGGRGQGQVVSHRKQQSELRKWLMQRRKHKRLRFASESELLEQTRLSVEYSKQLLRDTQNVLAENALLREHLWKLRKHLRNSN